ncbi:unnamed protein product [Prunus brigantina]
MFTCSSSSLLAAGSFSQYLALSLCWLALSRALSPSSPSSSLPPFYRPFTCEVWGRSPRPRSQLSRNARKAKL